MRRQISGWQLSSIALVVVLALTVIQMVRHEFEHRAINTRMTALEILMTDLLKNYYNYKSMHLQRVDFENVALEELYFRIRDCEQLAESARMIADSSYHSKYEWMDGLHTTQIDSIYLDVPENQWVTIAQELRESSHFQ